MYKCICGYKTSYKSYLESHMKSCNKVKEKFFSNVAHNWDDTSEIVLTSAMLTTVMSSCYSSSDYSGCGGSFDGGGSSGDW